MLRKRLFRICSFFFAAIFLAAFSHLPACLCFIDSCECETKVESSLPPCHSGAESNEDTAGQHNSADGDNCCCGQISQNSDIAFYHILSPSIQQSKFLTLDNAAHPDFLSYAYFYIEPLSRGSPPRVSYKQFDGTLSHLAFLQRWLI